MITNLKTIVIYLLVFFGTIISVQQLIFNDLFDMSHFLYWDAEHYIFIKNNGYAGRRVAFFPLFPLIWRMISVNAYWISVLNGFIFLISFIVLVKHLRIKNKLEILCYLSIPSFIFCFLPYSESFFFLASTFILIGFIRNQQLFIYIGLFISILTRPAFVILVPSFFIIALLSKKDNLSRLHLVNYTIITAVGVLLVAFIQYLDTGEWFKFFEAQKNWGNELQFPRLPLRSWGHGYALGLDGLAFLIGIISGGFILGLITKLKGLGKIHIADEFIYALSYLGGITLLVLLYRGGLLFSLNRFVFATPFVIVAFHYWIQQKFVLKNKDLLIIFIVIWLYWFLFESYINLYQMIKFTLLSFYVLLIFALKSDKNLIRKLSYILIILVNFSFQVISYVGFLKEKWIA